MTQEVGSQKRNGQLQMYTYLVYIRWKIMCETNSRRIEHRSLFGDDTRTLAWQWILYHEKTLVHSALRVCKFVTKKSDTKLNYPSHSSDLAPCEFWLFAKLKNALKEQKFADSPDIQSVASLLWGIPENDLLFPAVAPLSHKVLTRRVFWRWQQPLVHR
jgi:hypothetical protein